MTFSNIPEFKNKGRNNIFKGLDCDLVTLRNPQRLPFEQMVNENSFYLHIQNLPTTELGPKMKVFFSSHSYVPVQLFPRGQEPAAPHSKSSHSGESVLILFRILYHLHQPLPTFICLLQHQRQETNCPHV